MSDETVRCMRCNGRKKMYKVNGGYSHLDTGGISVNCPMCLGDGKVKTLARSIKDIENEKKDTKNR